MRKKGITPLIATVLLLGFTIVLAALVITWGTNLFKKTTENTGDVSDFNILCTTGYNLAYTATQAGTGIVHVTVKNNNEKKIAGFLFVTKSDDGKTAQTFSTDTSLVASSTGTGLSPSGTQAALDGYKILTFDLTSNPALDWKTLEIRPIATLDSGKKQICENEYSTIIN